MKIEILKSEIEGGRVKIQFGFIDNLDIYKFELKYVEYFVYMQQLGFLLDAKVFTRSDETLIKTDIDVTNPMTGENETKEFTCEISRYIQDNLLETEREVTELVNKYQPYIIQIIAAEIAA